MQTPSALNDICSNPVAVKFFFFFPFKTSNISLLQNLFEVTRRLTGSLRVYTGPDVGIDLGTAVHFNLRTVPPVSVIFNKLPNCFNA